MQSPPFPRYLVPPRCKCNLHIVSTKFLTPNSEWFMAGNCKSQISRRGKVDDTRKGTGIDVVITQKYSTHDRRYEEAIDTGCLPSIDVSRGGENTFFFKPNTFFFFSSLVQNGCSEHVDPWWCMFRFYLNISPVELELLQGSYMCTVLSCVICCSSVCHYYVKQRGFFSQ